MIKQLYATVLVTLLALSTTGCQLANSNLQQPAHADQLIGIFITTDRNDPHDIIYRRQSNSEPTHTSTDPTMRNFAIDNSYEIGVTVHGGDSDQLDLELDFGELQGNYFIYYACPSDVCPDKTTISQQDGVYSVHTRISVSDDGEAAAHSMQLFYDATSEISHFTVNPLYQRSDGTVYLTLGNSIGLAHSDDRQASTAYTLTTEVTQNINQKTTGGKREFNIEFTPKRQWNDYAIICFNATHQVVEVIDMSTDKPPTAIYPQEGTEYIVVQAVKDTASQGREISRQFLQRTDEGFAVYTADSTGVMKETEISIEWSD